jgi:hypothetical protein
MRSRSLAGWLPFALAALVSSCDPQADPGYPGEPLVTLHGQVVSSSPLPPLEAAMLWQRGPPPSTDDMELATRAPVETGFPASFTLHLYQPAPAAARRTLLPGEVTYARANAAAVPKGIPQDQVGPMAAAASPAVGLDAGHWVVYLASDVSQGSLTAWWLGAALPAGFHLLRVTAVNPLCISAAALEACVADLVQRGVEDDGTQDPGRARFFCLEPYRLAPAPSDDLLLLELGSAALPSGGSCP